MIDECVSCLWLQRREYLFPLLRGDKGCVIFLSIKKIHTPPAPSQEGKELPTVDINKLINHHLWFRMRQAILRSHVEARERDGSNILNTKPSLIFIYSLWLYLILFYRKSVIEPAPNTFCDYIAYNQPVHLVAGGC